MLNQKNIYYFAAFLLTKIKNTMQIGNLSNSQRFYSLHPLLEELFEFIKTHDFDKLEMGKLQIKGDDLYVMNLNVDGTNHTQPLEMHKKYIDVHIVLNGEEEIGWKSTDKIDHYLSDYNNENDCALSNENPSFFIKLHPEEYAIMFPEDAHAPAISDGKIRKLIGKIKI